MVLCKEEVVKLKELGSILYTQVLAVWVGGISIYTFLVTPVIFRTYGRDLAGGIVGTLMPHYFRYNLVLSLAGLALLLALRELWAPRRRAIALGLLLAAVLVQGYLLYGLYPKILAVKAQVASFEADPGSPARRQFRALHGVSMSLNLLMFVDGLALLALACRQRAAKGAGEEG
jgi:hypothetical protein